MDLKPVILMLLFSSVILASCAQEDTCKPHDLSFCFDKHRIWTCAPDGNPENSPAYTVQIVDCRTLTDARKPYCATHYWEDGSRGSTHCRDEPMHSSENFSEKLDDVSRDVEVNGD